MKHVKKPPHSTNRYAAGAIALISFVVGILLVKGCQGNQTSITDNQPIQKKEINELRKRIEQLERQINSGKVKSFQEIYKSTDTSYIKSITFRIGTKDDRLRIYWANGSNSDLPCTKEQSIWVCG